MAPGWPSEVLSAYGRVFVEAGGGLVAPLVAAIAFFVVCWTDKKPLPRAVAGVSLAVCVAIGLVLAARGLSILDDANYSFRYAENWAAGKGLVFNEGERVEGYTNFLWVVLLAAVAKISDARPHWAALVLGMASFAANVGVVARLGAVLHRGVSGWLPVAACLLALHTTFVAFATTGLETMFASLLVDLGLFALVAGERRAALASAAFLLATLTRMDHALFWGAGLLAVLATSANKRAALIRYALPLLPYAAVVVAKYAYYGAWLPNSYYVRAADEEHVQQGLVYGLTFLLGSHAWLLVALFAASFVAPARSEAERAFRWFAGIAVPLWVAYVTWVGGDYIYGRFYVVALPMLALGAERVAHALRERSAWAGALVGGAVVASAYGLPLLAPREVRWGIADETTSTDHTWRDLVDWDVILESRARFAFQDVVNLRIPLSVEGTGGFAYRTRLRVVEACGLVDPDVRERRRAQGAMAGHEKCLTRDQLLAEGVRLSFSRSVFSMGPSPKIPRVDGRWIDELCDGNACIHILAYDRALMRQLAATAPPNVTFVDFEAWLDDYVARIAAVPAAQLKTDLLFFHEYYFRFNDDPERLARLQAASPVPFPPPGATTAAGAAGLDGGALEGMSGFRERLKR